jgi:hypothetical protein
MQQTNLVKQKVTLNAKGVNVTRRRDANARTRPLCQAVWFHGSILAAGIAIGVEKVALGFDNAGCCWSQGVK